MFNRDPLENADSKYSIGTGIGFNFLANRLMESSDITDTILINISTLVRNRYEKGMKITDVSEMVLEEIDFMITDLVNLLTFNKKRGAKALCLYGFDYRRMIPTALQRTPTDSRLNTIVGTGIVCDKLAKKESTFSMDGVSISYLLNTKSNHTISDLLHFTRDLPTMKNVCMVSHVPIDWHIGHKIKQFYILETHTGHIVRMNDIPHKLWKTEVMPFTNRSHVLLGDSNHITPTIVRKAKKELLELADKEHWMLKSYGYVESKLKKYKPPFKLN